MKITLFSISLVASLTLLELGLRLAGEIYVERRGITQTKSVPVSTRDYKKSVSILALGDSFTFGGKLDAVDSYPAILEDLLKRKYPGIFFNVVNAGICEATTEDILARLEAAITLHAPDVLILLAGSANRFSILYDYASSLKPFVRAVTGLRVFKVGRWISVVVRDRLLGPVPTGDKLLARSGQSKAAQRFSNAVKDILAVPANESIEEMSFWLLKDFELQSAFSTNDVVSIFRDAARSAKDPSRAAELRKIEQVFADLGAWESRIAGSLESDLTKIVETAQKFGIRVILQNYPVDYKIANDMIVKISREKNVPVVDNLATFRSAIEKNHGDRSSFLFDDDHATRHGHLLMAKNVLRTLEPEVFKDIQKIIDHNREPPDAP